MPTSDAHFGKSMFPPETTATTVPPPSGATMASVAGAHGPHALAKLHRRQLSQNVICAADLERSDRLEYFELEIQIC
jgi:hypothetical protein